MLPGFKQLPDSAVKDWNGPDGEPPRYLLGMRAAYRANESRARSRLVFSFAVGYVVAVAVAIACAFIGTPWWVVAASIALPAGGVLRWWLRARSHYAVALDIQRDIEREARIRIIDPPPPPEPTVAHPPPPEPTAAQGAT